MLLHFTPVQDTFQIAYSEGRGVEDARIVFIGNLLSLYYRHLDKPSTYYYCRILFIDFSQNFNITKPKCHAQKLKDLKVNILITSWIIDSSNLTQYVQIDDVNSS